MWRDVIDWWLETLGGNKIPSGSRLLVRRDRFDIADRATSIDVSATPQQMAAFLAQNRPNVIVLDACRYVVRPLAPVCLPASRAEAMALLDLDASTPFKSQDSYAFQLRRTDAPEPHPTAYAIVKSSILDPLLEAVRHSRGTIDAILLAGTDETVAPQWCVRRRDVKRLTSSLTDWRAKLRLTAGCLLGFTLAGTIFHVHAVYARAEGEAARGIPALEVKARAVRDELKRRDASMAQAAALRHRAVEQTPMSGIWEELSNVLPDAAYLTDLTIKDGKASVIGFSGSASSLIAPIESSPMFEGAAFTSPVLRAVGQDGERFEMTFSIVTDS